MSKFKKGDKVVILQDKIPNHFAAKYSTNVSPSTISKIVCGDVYLVGVVQPFMPHWLAHAEDSDVVDDNPMPKLLAGDSVYLSSGELVYVYTFEGKFIISTGEDDLGFVELDLDDVDTIDREGNVIWEKYTEDEEEEPDHINRFIDDMIEIIAHFANKKEKGVK